MLILTEMAAEIKIRGLCLIVTTSEQQPKDQIQDNKNPESATLLQLPIICKGRIIQNLLVVAVLTDDEKPTELLECNCFDREFISMSQS